ncbi:hypothetical protein K469DRAFT_777883 [Zopfia rhizophila CBS 207.26]|uniref:Uncharacterized protein n=1 Tax=Zopfia rhizophila CBS 207.26 TaxID=1314779 RepID=A0A6A6E4G6_9PEZI|nr:hypothetical protein K469DRAFT_777883 [Zopfia rhizophila CBS 207.26]
MGPNHDHVSRWEATEEFETEKRRKFISDISFTYIRVTHLASSLLRGGPCGLKPTTPKHVGYLYAGTRTYNTTTTSGSASTTKRPHQRTKHKGPRGPAFTKNSSNGAEVSTGRIVHNRCHTFRTRKKRHEPGEVAALIANLKETIAQQSSVTTNQNNTIERVRADLAEIKSEQQASGARTPNSRRRSVASKNPQKPQEIVNVRPPKSKSHHRCPLYARQNRAYENARK